MEKAFIVRLINKAVSVDFTVTDSKEAAQLAEFILNQGYEVEIKTV